MPGGCEEVGAFTPAVLVTAHAPCFSKILHLPMVSRTHDAMAAPNQVMGHISGLLPLPHFSQKQSSLPLPKWLQTIGSHPSHPSWRQLGFCGLILWPPLFLPIRAYVVYFHI